MNRFKLCFQIQLAPLHPGVSAAAALLAARAPERVARLLLAARRGQGQSTAEAPEVIHLLEVALSRMAQQSTTIVRSADSTDINHELIMPARSVVRRCKSNRSNPC
jgi:hypothetical protein